MSLVGHLRKPPFSALCQLPPAADKQHRRIIRDPSKENAYCRVASAIRNERAIIEPIPERKSEQVVAAGSGVRRVATSRPGSFFHLFSSAEDRFDRLVELVTDYCLPALNRTRVKPRRAQETSRQMRDEMAER